MGTGRKKEKGRRKIKAKKRYFEGMSAVFMLIVPLYHFQGNKKGRVY